MKQLPNKHPIYHRNTNILLSFRCVVCVRVDVALYLCLVLFVNIFSVGCRQWGGVGRFHFIYHGVNSGKSGSMVAKLCLSPCSANGLSHNVEQFQRKSQRPPNETSAIFYASALLGASQRRNSLLANVNTALNRPSPPFFLTITHSLTTPTPPPVYTGHYSRARAIY